MLVLAARSTICGSHRTPTGDGPRGYRASHRCRPRAGTNNVDVASPEGRCPVLGVRIIERVGQA